MDKGWGGDGLLEDNRTYKYLGITDAFYLNGKWTERADVWHCDKCNVDFWSVPPVQKCLRKHSVCPSCDVKYPNTQPWHTKARLVGELGNVSIKVTNWIRRLWR